MSTGTLTILLFTILPFQPTFWIFLASRGVVLACQQTFFWHVDASYPPDPLRRILVPKFDQSKSGMIPVMWYIQRDIWITASPKQLNQWLYGLFCHNVHSGLNMRYHWILAELYTQLQFKGFIGSSGVLTNKVCIRRHVDALRGDPTWSRCFKGLPSGYKKNIKLSLKQDKTVRGIRTFHPIYKWCGFFWSLIVQKGPTNGL
jgi:hypothetical protein